jgi:CRP/FNR family transcriptional regulator
VLDSAQQDRLADAFPALLEEPGLAAALRVSATPAAIGRDSTICFEGDRCTRLALVLSGRARVFKLSESGREITLYRVEAGECCILTASCMLSQQAFPAHAITETDVSAVVVTDRLVRQWMQQHDAWRRFLWYLIATRLGDVIGLIEEVAFRRMDQRLAEYLAGRASADGGELRATHQQIAGDLGTSREVVSRLLKDFEGRGLLTLGRGWVRVTDPATVRTIASQSD